jgi:allene oxide cyclase
MKRLIVLSAAVLLSAACSSSTSDSPSPAASAATPMAAPSPKTTTVHVIEHATTDVVIDTGKPGDTTGDLLTWHNDIYDENDSAKVGTDQGSCIRIDVKGGTWECMWTTELDGGSLTVEGPFLDTGDSTIAVTGGTGIYQNVTGEMELKARAKDGSAYDFIFHLTGVQ